MYKKEDFLNYVKCKNPGEDEFLQSVEEVIEIIIPFINENPKYQNKALLERIIEPERIITFRVPWVDDNENIQVNRGFRVEFNSAIGPYKGGLRFHPSVNLSILKFLGFEQIFKNALTTLPIGGGKGGSDFDPKGKSDNEIMRFCQSFMSELYRHIGPNTDVPAGDIGVGSREIGFLFGQYKKLKNEFTGVLTGKPLEFGGSLIRPEATGYGLVYFIQNILNMKDKDLKGKKFLISGSGNVAQYAAKKVIELGGKVLTMSDSSGYIYVKDGITQEQLDYIMYLKNEKRLRISEFCNKYNNTHYFKGEKPWDNQADIALPCATQNEIDEKDSINLIKNGIKIIGEGANMPSTPSSIHNFLKNNIIFAPAKAANAGGVAVSALEMTQNSMRYSWKKEDVDDLLMEIMRDIHSQCVKYGKDKDGNINYIKGSNIAGFVKIADAMLSQGVV